jgi:hypothetical protein
MYIIDSIILGGVAVIGAIAGVVIRVWVAVQVLALCAALGGLLWWGVSLCIKSVWGA